MAKKITLKNKNGDVLCPHTAIEQVQGLKEALDNKLGKTEKAVSAKTTKVSKSSEADPNFALSFYAGQAAPSTTPTADKVYVGSSVDGSVISVPALDGSTSMANYMNLRMSFNSKFFHEIAVSPNSNGIYHRNVRNGNALEWKQLRTIDDKVTTSHIADTAITPAKIQTSIALNGTPSMTVEPTTSSPDKTIASVGLVKEAVDGIEIGGTNLLRYIKDDGSSYWDGGSGVTCDVTINGDVIKGQTNGNNNPRIYNSSTKEIVWEPNTDYVLSYYAKGQGDYSALIIIEGNNVNFCPFSDMGVYSSEWKKYVKKFTTPSDIIDANTQLLKFYCGHRNANDTTSWLEVKDIKIERGNKATDWSPAPEDIVNGIKIDTRNLLSDSEEITIDGSALTSGTKYEVRKLPISVAVGDVLTFNCEDLIINAGTGQTHAIVLRVPGVGALAPMQWISPTSKTATITVTQASDTPHLYIYAGYADDSAGKSITYKGATLVKGTKPMLLWQPSVEEVQGKIEAVKPTIFLQTLQPSATEVKEGDIWIIQ